ncbi:PHP domain-containing protein [Kiritimatiella glycovorans]|uniref:PHP domain protein n=1 Tax=Kiritimatiella glycovorans TaxID=1307763 RepID=A0A0G3EIY5_9BACT|nr:PHP domain-containing protein [Kiritimatiella glycovorans]AKJ64134.1 PHP domain protein [Kiritimatiella glycovorans]
MIDLHLHSTYSDGSDRPAELMRKAAQAGVTAAALTDHDTTDGVPEFAEAAEGTGVEAVPAIELSACYDGGSMHMLGYGIDSGNDELREAVRRICEGRRERNETILDRLRELGYLLEWDDVLAEAGGEVVGRPHFAQALITRGYFKQKRPVFDRLLGRGQPAYAERFRFSPSRCIKLITRAGGAPVVAHPVSLRLPRGKLRDLLSSLKDLGLAGVEVFYPEHNERQVRVYRKLARELRLVMTGGSDYHGSFTPQLSIGRGFGDLHVPDSALRQLRARMARTRLPGRDG